MSLPFDASLKSLVTDHPGDFVALFGLPADEPVKSINVDLSTLSAATDVALAYGNPVQTIVDLNFQVGHDPELPERLHLYSAALRRRHLVPVRSILVLLRKKADGANLTGTLTYGDAESGVEFRYKVIRLWEQPVESYLHANLSALPLATLCRMPADRPVPEALRDVVHEIRRRLIKEASHAEAMKLMTTAHRLTGLRVNKTDVDTIYRGDIAMIETTAYDEAVEEGELRGELRGKISTSHTLLLRQGSRRFGEPDAETESALKAIHDPERLERLADAILTAKSWSEFLATA